MAYTQADVDALKKAIAGGYQSVEYAGRKVVFRSVRELRLALADAEAEVARGSGSGMQPTSFASYCPDERAPHAFDFGFGTGSNIV